MRYTYKGHLQNMTVSPGLDMTTLSIGAYLCSRTQRSRDIRMDFERYVLNLRKALTQ
jgi:hypothetical protein